MQTNHPTRVTIALAIAFTSVSLVDCDEDASVQPTPPSAVAARVTGSSAAAQVVLGTSTCGVVDSNGNCVAAPFRAVVTNSAPGIEIERSYADRVFNDTGHAVVFTFADFGPPFGYCVSEVSGALSADWVETLSASGQATIVCRFRS